VYADTIKTVIIANPAAGAGRSMQMLPRIERAVIRQFGSCHIRLSDPEHSVDEWVRSEILMDATCLVVVGGDGTFNAAVNGCFQVPAERRNGVSFLSVPAATAGDFSRVTGAAGLSVEQIIRQSTPQTIDAGEILFSATGKRHHFINIASLGVSAAIAHGVNLRSKRFGGHVSFVSQTLRTLRSWRDVRICLRVDDHPEREIDMTCVAVANGRCFGSGMQIAPDALLNDGLLDVVVLENMGAWTFISRAHRLYRGGVLSLKGASLIRGRRISLTPLNESVMLEADGEFPGNAPVEISILPSAITMLAPWHRATTLR
jgi:YegS/Rv2252/BmrU family lipid kinase